MDLSSHNLNTLFAQLGLPATDEEIESFFESNTLEHDGQLLEAEFWSVGQVSFLKESLELDSDWAELVDYLDARLRH